MEKVLSLKIKTSPADLERIAAAKAVLEELCSIINEVEGISNDDPFPAYSVSSHEQYVSSCWSCLEMLSKVERGEVF